MTTLQGKIAFVTGGSKGIGFACAHRLAQNGANVFLAASDTVRLENATAKIIESTGRRVWYHAADLRTLGGCESAAEALEADCGRCDILVNCAGATRGGLFPGQPDEDMVDGFALKFHGAVRMSRLLWPMLAGSGGTVVNIVGGYARTPRADFMVGGAVNAALANFSKALAEQGLRDDVNVNWIHPGLTVTDRLDRIFSDRAEQQGKSRGEVEQQLVAQEGIRRLGMPEDVASLVAFLCSSEARHIHGTGIAVDGGGAKGYQ